MMHPLVLAITGASGAVYAIRLLEVLLSAGHSVHLTISPAGQMVLDQELGVSVDLEHFSENSLRLNLKKNAEVITKNQTCFLQSVQKCRQSYKNFV